MEKVEKMRGDFALSANFPPAFLLTGADVVLADGVQQLDVLVQDGKIGAIGANLPAGTTPTFHLPGRIIFPGFIDSHTHFGIPIMETTSADDFATGSMAAAWGGVTTIIDFTVQAPGQSPAEALAVRCQKAKICHVDYTIHVNITDRPEQYLAEIPLLIKRGFPTFKLFSTYRQAGMMVSWPQFRQVMAAVGQQGGLILLHAEDNDIVERETARHLAAGHFEPIYHARSRPAEAEAAAITQAAQIAAELNAALYIVHLSSQAGLEAGLKARQQGVNIYLETCPHYLLLTEEKYRQANGHCYITTPALRTQADVDALWQAVTAGDIDTIATDHCPFTLAQKELGNRQFQHTPNGLPGVATLFPLLYSYGVAAGKISLTDLVRLLAGNPARIFGLSQRKGQIAVGLDGDLVVWNPAGTSHLTATTIPGRADWSPFEGLPIAGQLEYTFLRGQCLVAGGQFVGHQVSGELLESGALPVTSSK